MVPSTAFSPTHQRANSLTSESEAAARESTSLSESRRTDAPSPSSATTSGKPAARREPNETPVRWDSQSKRASSASKLPKKRPRDDESGPKARASTALSFVATKNLTTVLNVYTSPLVMCWPEPLIPLPNPAAHGSRSCRIHGSRNPHLRGKPVAPGLAASRWQALAPGRLVPHAKCHYQKRQDMSLTLPGPISQPLRQGCLAPTSTLGNMTPHQIGPIVYLVATFLRTNSGMLTLARRDYAQAPQSARVSRPLN
ncbi:hypothetical protein SaccyDRAFT_2271 [Saccharomonospora cyanea NA-134]|uniref:Uncharacterized protein n=1 Tax=Saccharomonospora cyanea NA-134 TaxID=882082 RepID=H5XPS3_9PSEU|nr:hypothetical protein SaccyDRAFT_2271 [Saccharomonospora cyanea NA-134]